MTKPRQPRYKQIFRENPERAEMAALFWKDVVADLVEAGNVTAAQLARADRYARARVEYEELHPVAVEEGPVLVGETNGGEYFNYRWSACEKLGDRLLKLEKAMFGEATATRSEKPKRMGKAASDEFLGPDHGIRQ